MLSRREAYLALAAGHESEPMKATPVLLALSILTRLSAEGPALEKRQITENEAFARADQLVANVLDALDPSAMDIEDPRTIDVDHEEGYWVHSVQLRALGDTCNRSRWVAAVNIVDGGKETWMTPCRGGLRLYERQGSEVKLVTTSAESALERAFAAHRGPSELGTVPFAMGQSVRLDPADSWRERSHALDFEAQYQSIANG